MVLLDKITNNEKIISETFDTFERSLLQMQEIFEVKKQEIDKEVTEYTGISTETAKSFLSEQISYKLTCYDELISTYYETSIITLYSLYEKLFTMLMAENNVLKQKKRGSLVNTYIISIKKQFKDIKIDKKTNRSIVNIEKLFRKLRNHFARESYSSSKLPIKLNYFGNTDGMVFTQSGIIFKNANYVIQTAQEMKNILLDINQKIEMRKNITPRKFNV